MRKEAILLTGSAGFIGTNLTKYFLSKKEIVIGIDNFKLGKKKNIEIFLEDANFFFFKLDISNLKKLDSTIKKLSKIYKIKTIWHLAANSDIRAGFSNLNNDYKNTFLTTYNLIKIAKKYKIENFAFASSSAVYGDLGNIKLKENSGPLLPISAYGAMKLASEGIISAAVENFLKKAFIFRFPNVVGHPPTHGIIYDFIKKLKKTPYKLNVLGNGSQRKIYMHVEDLINSMIFIFKNSKDNLSLFNIGPEDSGVTVNFISREVTKYFKRDIKIIYEKKIKGWAGDVPKFKYSTQKIKKLGLSIKKTSKIAIKQAIEDLIKY